MDVQPIPYRGRVVAAAPAECFLLADDLAYRPSGDPGALFVVMMCAYASDVARGVLPGPYDNDDACRYARAVLVPEELLERCRVCRARRVGGRLGGASWTPA